LMMKMTTMKVTRRNKKLALSTPMMLREWPIVAFLTCETHIPSTIPKYYILPTLHDMHRWYRIHME